MLLACLFGSPCPRAVTAYNPLHYRIDHQLARLFCAEFGRDLGDEIRVGTGLADRPMDYGEQDCGMALQYQALVQTLAQHRLDSFVSWPDELGDQQGGPLRRFGGMLGNEIAHFGMRRVEL